MDVTAYLKIDNSDIYPQGVSIGMNLKLVTLVLVIILAVTAIGVVVYSNSNNNQQGGDTPIEEKDVTIIDSLGREVTIRSPVKSFCTVNSSAAEFFQILGVSDRIVGADSSIVEKIPIYKDVTNIGNYKTPSGEVIASTGSKIVISQSSSRAISDATEQALKDNYGITVLRLDCYGETMMRDIGELLKILISDKAETAFQEYKGLYDSITNTVLEKSKDVSGDPAFLLFYTSMSKTEGTYYSEKSELSKKTTAIHGHNALIDMGVTSTSMTAKPSAEAIYDFDQEGNLDIIILRGTSGKDPSVDYQVLLDTGKSIAGFDSMNVIQAGNIYVIHTEVMSGPRDYIGLVCIAEAFGIDTGLDYDQLTNDFNDKYGFVLDMGYVMAQFPAA